MSIKYIRVIFAIREEMIEVFKEQLDGFIEHDDYADPDVCLNNIEGAYVSDPYDTREAGLGKDFKQTV